VLSWRLAKAGKEKLAGDRENTIGMEAAKCPVAFRSGDVGMKEKEGTRGMVKARMMPILFNSTKFEQI
jgi:hypothetical protein